MAHCSSVSANAFLPLLPSVWCDSPYQTLFSVHFLHESFSEEGTRRASNRSVCLQKVSMSSVGENSFFRAPLSPGDSPSGHPSPIAQGSVALVSSEGERWPRKGPHHSAEYSWRAWVPFILCQRHLAHWNFLDPASPSVYLYSYVRVCF